MKQLDIAWKNNSWSFIGPKFGTPKTLVGKKWHQPSLLLRYTISSVSAATTTTGFSLNDKSKAADTIFVSISTVQSGTVCESRFK